MSIISVGTTTDLIAAAKAAVSGDIIKLASGSYSSVLLKYINPTGNITITSADPLNPAVFNDLNLSNSSNITLSNVVFQTPANSLVWYNFQVLYSSNINLTQILADGPGMTPIQDTTGLIVRWSNGVHISDSEFRNLVNGIVFLDNTNISVADSYFHDMRRDGIDSGGNSKVAFTNNFFTNFHPNAVDHPDAIQFWTANTTTVASDILVSGNVIVRGASGSPIQGIFIKDEVGTLDYQGVTITNNLVLGGLYNGINLDGVGSGVVSGNQVLEFAGQSSFIRTMNSGALLSLFGNTATAYVTQINESSDNTTVAALSDGGQAVLDAWKLTHTAPGGVGGWDTLYVEAGYAKIALATTTTAVAAADPAPAQGSEVQYGTASNDTLTATSGLTSTVYARDGNDSLVGNGSSSRLFGGAGGDSYTLKGRGDSAVEVAGEGYDAVTAFFDYNLADNIEALYLAGNAHVGRGNALDNTIVGNSGSDYIYGGDGNDWISGGAGGDGLCGENGNDVIRGGSGNDKMWGGAGIDTFRFAQDSVTSRDNDEIFDFAVGVDKIDLAEIDAKVRTSSNDVFKLIGTANFHQRAGELQVKAYGDGVMVAGDVNGDGVADFNIYVHGVSALNAGDFNL